MSAPRSSGGFFFFFIVFVLLKYRNLDSEGLGLDLWIHLLKTLLMILLNMELRKHLRKTGLVSRLLPSRILFCNAWAATSRLRLAINTQAVCLMSSNQLYPQKSLMFFQLCLKFGRMPRYTDSPLAPVPNELPQKYGSSESRDPGIPAAQKSKPPLTSLCKLPWEFP